MSVFDASDDSDSHFARHVPYTVKLLSEVDLITDPSLVKYGPDGRKETIVPFRLGTNTTSVMRREVSRPSPQQPMISQAAQQAQAVAAQQAITNGTPISMQQQIKVPSVGVSHMRISNGGMRSSSLQSSSPPHSASPTHPNMQFSPPAINGNGNGGRAAMTMPHVEPLKSEATYAVPTGVVSNQQRQASPHTPESIINGNYITRPKSQEPNHANYTSSYQMNGHQAMNNAQFQNTALSLQQMQSLKTILASQGQDIQGIHVNGMRQIPASYMHGNYNGMKLPNVRQQTQWSPSSPMQRPASVTNGFDSVNGPLSPHMGQNVPARSPSANGMRRMMPSPHMPQQSPSPMPLTSQSPRPPPAPVMTPSQPIVQGGY